MQEVMQHESGGENKTEFSPYVLNLGLKLDWFKAESNIVIYDIRHSSRHPQPTALSCHHSDSIKTNFAQELVGEYSKQIHHRSMLYVEDVFVYIGLLYAINLLMLQSLSFLYFFGGGSFCPSLWPLSVSQSRL